MLFPTSLCGVLVFDYISRPASTPPSLRRLRLRFRLLQLCVTHHLSSFAHSFVTPLFVTHHLSHTTLSDTISHHLSSFTHIFVTHHLSHTTLSHTIFHTQLCHTPSFMHNFVTHHFAWQAWLLATSTFILRGRRGLGDLHLCFAWQAWQVWPCQTPAI